jgi:hypothetical protein
MDIEQLKIVLETLRGIGQDAGNIAVLWMWLKFGASVLSSLAMGLTVVGVVWFISRAVILLNGNEECEIFVREMRGMLGTGTSGCLTPNERTRTQEAIRTLVNEHLKNNSSNRGSK